MHRLQRGAGKFELPARLEADIGLAALKGDDVLALIDAFPAESHQPIQQGLNPGGTAVRNGLIGPQAEHEFLMFGADLPIAGRL